MCGCANKSNSQNKVHDTVKPLATQSFTGVITSVDKELKQLSVREIDTLILISEQLVLLKHKLSYEKYCISGIFHTVLFDYNSKPLKKKVKLLNLLS